MSAAMFSGWILSQAKMSLLHITGRAIILQPSIIFIKAASSGWLDGNSDCDFSPSCDFMCVFKLLAWEKSYWLHLLYFSSHHLYIGYRLPPLALDGWMEILTLGSLRPSGWCERASKGQRGPKRARGW